MQLRLGNITLPWWKGGTGQNKKGQYGTAAGMKELPGQGEFRREQDTEGDVGGFPHLAPDANPHKEILSLHLKKDVYMSDLVFLAFWRRGTTWGYCPVYTPFN